MTPRSGWILWMAAALLAGSAAADTNAPRYTLDDCVRIGLERATVIGNARRDEEIAAARIRQVRAGVYPQVGTKAGYARLDAVPSMDADGESIPMGREDNYSASAGLDQLLFSGGKVSAALEAARLYRDFAVEGTARTKARLERDITTAFRDLLLLRHATEVTEDSVRQLEEFVRQTETKFRSQTVSEFDLLSAKVRLANERPKMIRARNALSVSREAFRTLTRIDDADFVLDGELAYAPAAYDLAALQDGARTLRPELRQMRLQINLFEQDVVVAKGDYYPSLHGFAQYAGTDPDTTEFGSDTWGWHWSAGVTAQWSLFDGGLRRGVIQEKRLGLAKARADYDELTRVVLLEIKQAYLDLQDAAEATKGSQENVELAERALGIARTRYDAGLSTYLEFTETNLALRTAKLSLYQALRDHMNALTRLRHAAGLSDDPPAPAGR